MAYFNKDTSKVDAVYPRKKGARWKWNFKNEGHVLVNIMIRHVLFKMTYVYISSLRYKSGVICRIFIGLLESE